ncbi:hypothetical protein TIFTF001_037252 [Ficus carica]|uniref:Gag-pol polyprotein n=1 Tax=Ficus carica TaxID=3494 RepID=A0AA88J8P8_FICCA|nr:hypothetical protein TIFTF001_037252 [Ficus carica]
MRLDELMGSLQTFEMNLKHNKKKKSIALQAKKKGKSLITAWSDEESERSQVDDEDQVRNYVAFNIVSNSVVTVTKTVATSSAIVAKIDDSGAHCSSDNDLTD